MQFNAHPQSSRRHGLPSTQISTFHVKGTPDLVTDIYDLYSQIPYASLDEATREELWDDGLHLTREGCHMMDNVIAERPCKTFDSRCSPFNDNSNGAGGGEGGDGGGMDTGGYLGGSSFWLVQN